MEKSKINEKTINSTYNLRLQKTHSLRNMMNSCAKMSFANYASLITAVLLPIAISRRVISFFPLDSCSMIPVPQF